MAPQDVRPSITFWTRIEPRPRSTSIRRNLSACVRDPLWFLTRQWQFGEFMGEDAASPTYIEISPRAVPMGGWRASGERLESFDKDRTPLEPLIEAEAFAPDLATAVELGQKFESLLEKAELAILIPQFREKYPCPGLSDVVSKEDYDLNRFLRVCGGRAIHGIRLLEDACSCVAKPLESLNVDESRRDSLVELVKTFLNWVQSVFGCLPRPGEPIVPAWRSDQLEYNAEISTTSLGADSVVLDAHPGRNGEMDWYSFDTTEALANGEGAPVQSRSVLPMNVRFRGMPNARWWQFEHSSVDFGDIRPERLELAKVVLMDFMLIHSNDWFILPLSQPMGTLCQIDKFVVHDVFGGATVVDRADRRRQPSDRDWSVFTTTIKGANGELADFFVLPPSATITALSGETVEEVQFVRDEMANMVWAIEHVAENGIGMPWLDHERMYAGREEEALGSAQGDPNAPLLYRIQTSVPEHWVPFLPVLINASRHEIILKQGSLLAQESSRVCGPIGRILSGLTWVREEEISRIGARILRVVRRSRWIDGSTHLWIARCKRAGGGESSSGLRFDVAIAPPVSDSDA